MIAKKYQRKTDQWWRGRKVVFVKKIMSGISAIAPGTVVIVKKKYGGLRIEGNMCPHCGASPIISHVDYSDLVLYDEVVELSRENAQQRAESEHRNTKQNMCVVAYEGKYLVLPYNQEDEWAKEKIVRYFSF
jgi:hypothetical protein